MKLQLNISRPGVSQHLAVLEAAGLVTSRREGRYTFHDLDATPLRQITARRVGDSDWWLTVVAPDDPEGTELLLEPAGHPAVTPYGEALVADGIPLAQFAVDDVRAELESLRGLGVGFTQEPLSTGPVTTAVLADACGNLVQVTGPA
ncbi:VOC family protein [Isoptericola halotolerans]|uniref:VOC family protein n=1 Tax=Isoptericola halotolerans TaxID=300560 RepID=UPI00388DE8ED